MCALTNTTKNALVCAVALAGFAFASIGSAQEATADWAFIQSVGGMKLGTPQRDGEVWLLPIECDLTGLRKITVDPTTLNSSQVIKEQRWSQQGDQIRLQLILKPSSYATSESKCQPLRLTAPAGKQIEVVYQDGNRQMPIGTVKLEAK